jgi:hypothetical protein
LLARANRNHATRQKAQIVPAVRLNQKVAVAIVFVSAMFMNIMDLMRRLSNPPDTLETVAEQGFHDAPSVGAENPNWIADQDFQVSTWILSHRRCYRMRDVGRSASSDVLSGTSSLVSAPGEVFGTHRAVHSTVLLEVASGV